MNGRLLSVYPSKARSWFQAAGFSSEHSFWASLGGNVGTVDDCMNAYFDSLGYTGEIDDKLRKFLVVQTGINSTMFDMVNQLFDTPWGGGGTGNTVTDTDNNTITDTDGNIIKDTN
jgi:hypothetical protein